MSQHTAGPWRLIEMDGKAVGVQMGRAGGFIIDAGANPEANARLIAAAPELLDALKAVEWAWNAGPPKHQYCACCGRWKDDGHNAVCRVRAAIQKAEGA